jgi:hypothetical protein
MRSNKPCLRVTNNSKPPSHLALSQPTPSSLLETQAVFLKQFQTMHKFQQAMSKHHQHFLVTLTTCLTTTSATTPKANLCPIATHSGLSPAVTVVEPTRLPQKHSSIATVVFEPTTLPSTPKTPLPNTSRPTASTLASQVADASHRHNISKAPPPVLAMNSSPNLPPALSPPNLPPALSPPNLLPALFQCLFPSSTLSPFPFSLKF